MLSEMPIKLERVSKGDLEKEVLRIGMIAELDAVSLYDQLAAMTENQHIKRVFLDIAREEKIHVGEFQALLVMQDTEQEMEEGRKEVDELKP